MADASVGVPESQTLSQGVTDLRQAWVQLARELAPRVPELPSVIEQQLRDLHRADLTEEHLIHLAEAVVRRVENAGYPADASALFRRMGRAMYELLLLLATEAELLEMHVRVPARPAAGSSGALPAAVPVVRHQPSPAPPAEPPAADEELEISAATPEGLEFPDEASAEEPTATVLPISALTAEPPPQTLPPSPVTRPVVAADQPRDPLRPPARPSTPVLTVVPPAPGPPAEASTPALPDATPLPVPAASFRRPPDQALPQKPPPPAQAVPAGPAPPPPRVAEVVPLPRPPAPPTPAPAPRPAAPKPAVPAPAAQAPTPPSPPTPAPADQAAERRPPADPPARAVPEPPVAAPLPLERDAASLWGFDPESPTEAPEELAAAPVEVVAEPEPPPPPEPPPAPADLPQPTPSPAPAAAAAPPAAAVTPQAARNGSSPVERQSGWMVRLSPRTTSERDKRLQAREGQLPELLREISEAAEEQRRGAAAKGTAHRLLEAARRQLPEGDGRSTLARARERLQTEDLEQAAVLVLVVSEAFPGEESAALACEVGELAERANEAPLALLCYTSAVLADPPCDAACWKLCNLAVERRDPVQGPVWLEFIARLLRARGADGDAISVYRQLLRLAPRRRDIRDLLRTSSLTGVLPD
ncbi:MAG: tetratricopeptide repeat protein [Candidatus Dormibacteria bacterium]